MFQPTLSTRTSPAYEIETEERRLMKSPLFLLVISWIVHSVTSVSVQTPDGEIRGSSANNLDYFRGIPYAVILSKIHEKL